MFVSSGESRNSVQFMHLDLKCNLFAYQHGARCSGIPHKIEQDFTQEELELVTSGSHGQDNKPIWNKFNKVLLTEVHRLGQKTAAGVTLVWPSRWLLSLLLSFTLHDRFDIL